MSAAEAGGEKTGDGWESGVDRKRRGWRAADERTRGECEGGWWWLRGNAKLSKVVRIAIAIELPIT
ncbi:hypothetical protein CVT26_009733 [Gymnopilus dilepis]|uniref:Uncharacterized protein n=1 Tax=Gymnopilus dilepis TaxID=231916 RepID=A0A409WCR1_9AGAR|nr:hypothetical protein CVT26_009733 [Gymnopilus dilepis]